MIRTQIQLTEKQAKALKRVAAQRGMSASALVREAVERITTEDDKWARALRAVGRFRSGAADVARDHDRYLADAYQE